MINPGLSGSIQLTLRVATCQRTDIDNFCPLKFLRCSVTWNVLSTWYSITCYTTWISFLDILTNFKIRKNLIFDNLLMVIRWSFMENTCTYSCSGMSFESFECSWIRSRDITSIIWLHNSLSAQIIWHDVTGLEPCDNWF